MTPDTQGEVDDVTTETFETDLSAYKHALRTFLRAEPSLDRWRQGDYPSAETRNAEHALLVAELSRGRWNHYGWPAEAGGAGGDPLYRAVLYDELSAAGLPVPDQFDLIETLGPPVVKFAPHLAAEYFPRYLSGQEWWAQCFSEPEAGSDLAALRTRAQRDGDDYVVTGHKLWASHGVTATRAVCLVRTGTVESRHRGLSMLMIDLSAPGVSVRPVALASGLNELAEIYFDDVVVPASRLIGEEGQGWTVAMYLLQYERAMYAWASGAVALRHFDELRDQLRVRRNETGRPLAPGAGRRLADCYADIITLRAQSARTVHRLAAGEAVGPEASVDKVLLATAKIGLYDVARELLGPEFLLGSSGQSRKWRSDWWFSRSATILGGSAEVQRTIIADHLLKLPKEPKP